MQDDSNTPDFGGSELLTASQAAKLVKVATTTITRNVDAGKLSSAGRKGKDLQIEPSELQRWYEHVYMLNRSNKRNVAQEGESSAVQTPKTPLATHELELKVAKLEGQLEAAKGLADERAERIASMEKNISEEREEWRQFRLMITHQQEAKKGFFARLFG